MDSVKLNAGELEAFIKEEKDQEFFLGRHLTEEPRVEYFDDDFFKYKEEQLGKIPSPNIDTTHTKEETEEITVHVENVISDTAEEELYPCPVKLESAGRQEMLNDSSFKCNFCQRYFSEEKILRKHIEGHTEERIGNIAYDKNAHCQTDIKPFIRKLTEENSFKCENCGKHFSGSAHLSKTNMLTEKPFRCELCQLSLLTKQNKKHTGGKSYKCDQCGKCFTRRSALKMHVRIHTGEKPFRCEECGKCFSRAAHLERHNRIHTGQEPFKCEQCGKSFYRLFSLAKHNRTTHGTHAGEKTFKCEQCGKCFEGPSQLNTHKITNACQQSYGNVMFVMWYSN